jgi:arylsulfatase
VVEERGELDRTVVVLVSDHGEMNGDFGMIYKQNFLNGSVRVPFVVRVPPGLGPSVPGRVSEHVVELMDVGATLAELAGAELPGHSYARSVVPSLVKGNKPPRRAALSGYRRELMIATRRWKAAVNHVGKLYLLFDLAEDPGETRNLAGMAKYAEVEERMRMLLLERLVATLRYEPEP